MKSNIEAVCNIPEEGTKGPMKNESTISDKTNSDTQAVCSYASVTANEENRPEILRVSSVRCLKEKLLVLDINGLLVDIVYPPPKDHKADAIVTGQPVFVRPFCLEFLKFCFEKFEVGLWTAGERKHVEGVIDYLMGDLKHKLLFCWDLSHCTKTSSKTFESKHKRLVFKDLRKIWEKQDPNLPWEKGYYNESNTLLLDDSPHKGFLNPPHTSVFPHTYRFKNKCHDDSLGAGGDLREYLEGMAKAGNMKEHVEQNPFGQEGISERSESWNFYLQVIGNISTNQLGNM